MCHSWTNIYRLWFHHNYSSWSWMNQTEKKNENSNRLQTNKNTGVKIYWPRYSYTVRCLASLLHVLHINLLHFSTWLMEPQTIPQQSHRDSLHFDKGDLQPVLCARWKVLHSLLSCPLMLSTVLPLSLSIAHTHKGKHKYTQDCQILCGTWTQAEIHTP